MCLAGTVSQVTVQRIRIAGDPVLHTPTRRVETFDAELRALVADMFETMYVAEGVGLAANQIGVALRVFVYDCSDADGGWHIGTVVIRRCTRPSSRTTATRGACRGRASGLDVRGDACHGDRVRPGRERDHGARHRHAGALFPARDRSPGGAALPGPVRPANPPTRRSRCCDRAGGAYRGAVGSRSRRKASPGR